MKIHRAINRIKGLTLIEVLVIVVVFFVLAALLLPSLAGGPRKSTRIGCVNNLKQIGLAYRIWAGDNGDKFSMEIYATNVFAIKLAATGNSYVLWRAMSNELATPKILHCPADKQRTNALSFTQGFSDANISYFFNLNGVTTDPQMILAGDDNLIVNGVRVSPGILNLSTSNSVSWAKERHDGAGNAGLADGSVQMISSAGLKLLLITTNRLVIP